MKQQINNNNNKTELIKLGNISQNSTSQLGCVYYEGVSLTICAGTHDYCIGHILEEIIHEDKINSSLNDITEIKIRCFDHKEPIFTGKPSELIEWVQVQADI